MNRPTAHQNAKDRTKATTMAGDPGSYCSTWITSSFTDLNSTAVPYFALRADEAENHGCFVAFTP